MQINSSRVESKKDFISSIVWKKIYLLYFLIEIFKEKTTGVYLETPVEKNYSLVNLIHFVEYFSFNFKDVGSFPK